jgi:hypothetical protein
MLAANNATNKQCKFSRLIDELSDDDAKDVKKALENPNVKTEVLARVLTANGHSIGSSTVSLHRRGECCCVIGG